MLVLEMLRKSAILKKIAKGMPSVPLLGAGMQLPKLQICMSPVLLPIISSVFISRGLCDDDYDVITLMIL
jgi:hypothetical protein